MKKQVQSFYKAFIAITLATIIIAMPSNISAQSKKKKKSRDDDQSDHEWDYTIKRNDPANIAKVNLFLAPLCMEAFGLPGGGLGAFASIKDQVSDNIEAFSSVTYNYLVLAKVLGNYEYLPASLGPNLGCEIGATWFFSDETREKKEDVLLYTENTGYRSYVNYVTKIPLKHQMKFGVRLSYMFMNYSAGYTDGFYNVYNTEVSPASKIPISGGDLLTNAQSGTLAIGLASEKVHDYKLSFKNGRERDVSRRMSWHLDLLVNTFTNFDNVKYNDSTYNVNKFTDRSPLGFRVGFESENLTSFGGNFGFDLGALPGPESPLLIMSFKYGFGLAFNGKE